MTKLVIEICPVSASKVDVNITDGVKPPYVPESFLSVNHVDTKHGIDLINSALKAILLK